MENFVTFQESADESGVGIDTIRRNAKKLELEITRRKTPRSKGSLVNCLSRDDADTLRAFFDSKSNYENDPSSSELTVQRFGYFYLIQLIPEVLPKRIKIGYTDNLDQRLSEHRTAAPTCKLIKSWECKRSWDQAVMDSITRENCEHVLNEVYEGDIDSFIQRGNDFFNHMPLSTTEINISEYSPLHVINT
jgi:hypothetical protein